MSPEEYLKERREKSKNIGISDQRLFDTFTHEQRELLWNEVHVVMEFDDETIHGYTALLREKIGDEEELMVTRLPMPAYDRGKTDGINQERRRIKALLPLYS